MSTYTLWVVSEPLSEKEALLVVESPEGGFGQALLAKDENDVRRFLAANGMPAQISANHSAAVRVVRDAEHRLFQVPATVLKPKELTSPLASLLLRAHRREQP
jgi:hypothetical protein